MKYSEHQDYLEYISRKAAGDLNAAKQSLMKCLDSCDDDAIQRSDLLQRLGELFFLTGNTARAIELYEESEACDPDSLLAQYYYAKFLAIRLGDYERAISKCDRIVALALKTPFEESETDFSSADYVQMAKELRESCVQASKTS